MKRIILTLGALGIAGLALGAQVLVVPQGGSGNSAFPGPGTGSGAGANLLYGNGTDKILATSSPTVGWITATSTSGTSLFMGNVTVLGTCTGCSGTSADLQDAYNASGDDAQITTASAKDIIFFLQNTATDANFSVNIDAASGGIFAVQQSSSGAGTTTPFSINRDGSTNIGIGTGTPAGLTVNATSSIFGANVTIYGGLALPFIHATSSTANIFSGDIGSTAVRVPNIYATNLDTLTMVVGKYADGDFTIAGDLYVNGGQLALGTGVATSTLEATASSTWLGGLIVANTAGKGGLQVVNGGINIAGDSLFSGVLKVSSVSTSTFSGGITSVGLASSAGLTLTGGHILSSGRLEITSGATSTNAGGLKNTGDIDTTGIFSSISVSTSSLDGSLDIDRNLIAGRTIIGGSASTTSNDINCSDGNYQELILDRDIAVKMASCYGGQVLTLGIWALGGGDFQIDWDGPSASSSLMWPSSTSTVGYIEQGRFNMCGFRFATGTLGTVVAAANCGLGYEFR